MTNNLHVKWEHPFSSKKTVCSTEDEYQRDCTVMKQKLLKRGSNKNNLNIQMQKVDLIEQTFFCKIKQGITTRKT